MLTKRLAHKLLGGVRNVTFGQSGVYALPEVRFPLRKKVSVILSSFLFLLTVPMYITYQIPHYRIARNPPPPPEE